MKKTLLVSVVSLLLMGASAAVAQEVPGYTAADVLEQQLSTQNVQAGTAEIVCAAHPEGEQRIFYAVGYYPRRVQIRAVGRCELDSSQRCRALGCIVKK